MCGRFFDAKMWEKKTIIDGSQFIQVWHGIIPNIKRKILWKYFIAQMEANQNLNASNCPWLTPSNHRLGYYYHTSSWCKVTLVNWISVDKWSIEKTCFFSKHPTCINMDEIESLKKYDIKINVLPFCNCVNPFWYWVGIWLGS